MSKRQQRAATARVTPFSRLEAWINHNIGCLGESLLRLFLTPLASLLTMAVLGIALALPGGLYMLTTNLLNLSGNWETNSHITLYLTPDLTNAEGEALSLKLNDSTQYQSARFLTREQSLQEFKQMTRFDEALDKLEQNPLPPVILLTPLDSQSTEQLEAQLQELRNLPQVELAQLDLQWIKRLQGILEISQRSLLVIFSLLAIAVVLIVGNTIRLEIENRRDEIIITKLFGATPAFIRRPFLYDGLWFGLFGGLFASLIIIAALLLLDGPINHLISLYDSAFKPNYPSWLFLLLMTGIGGLLGYLGAWSAVAQHLHKIEPD